MDWLNLHSSTLDSPEFIRSDPVRRSAWICLLRYCVGQENGGRITNCKHWGDTTWQQLCRVKLKEVNLNCELYWWENNDLITGFYPIEKEIEVKVNRENGKRGGRPPSKPNGNQVVNHTVSPGLGIAETEGKGRERKGKEEEGADTRSRSEKVRSFLENLGAKTRKGNEDLIVEWEAVLKGLKNKRIQEIFANAKPGIIWPSQFLQWRNAQGGY